jgi:hypothetical protein
MALGDKVTAIQSVVATTGVLDIRPASGIEWTIHNIYYSQGTVEFYKTDGTNNIKFDSDTSNGARLGAVFHVTNSQWIQVKNTAGTATIIGYDGVQTK